MAQEYKGYREYGEIMPLFRCGTVIMTAALLVSILLSLVLPVKSAFAEITDHSARSEPDKVPVITYHDILPYVSEHDDSNISVISLRSFASQMEYLYKNGFYTASLPELEDHVKGAKILPPKSVVITFDDGYESNYLYCYPYLMKYNFRAAVFMIGKVPEKSRPHLTALQVTGMIRPGMVEIGCHTYDCHRLIEGRPALKALPELQVKSDFFKFNDFCRKVGIPRPAAIAYPYGEFSQAAIESARAEGYRLGFTIKEGYVRDGDQPMTLKRFLIGPDTSMDDFISIVSGNWQ